MNKEKQEETERRIEGERRKEGEREMSWLKVMIFAYFTMKICIDNCILILY